VRITTRYVLREHLGPLLFSLSALTSLLLLNYIARKFGDLAGKGIPARVIAEFFLLSVPFTVAMTLPMAVLVSALYAFSRLASENEITAYKASGVSMGRLLTPALWAATVMAGVMVLFNDQVLPRANHRLSILQGDVARARPTFLLRPRVINKIGDKDFYLQANQIDGAENTMRQVTIYDLSPANSRTIRADSGAIRLAPNRRDILLTLYDGTVEQVGQSKTEELQRIKFAVDVFRQRDVAKGFDASNPGEQSGKGDREMNICELDGAYQQARRERDQAARELAAAVADSAARRAPRALPPQSEAERRREHLGLGRLYCAATRRAGRLAAAALPAVLPRVAQAQGLRSAVPRPAAAAPAAVSGESFAASNVQIARLRFDQLRSTVNGYDVEIHKKFALAVACLVFVLLGAPIALRFPRGGVGMVLGVSLFVFALYYSFLIAGQELASRGTLPPWLAMWAANLLFGAVGLVMALRMGSESGSARGGGLREAWEQWRWRRQLRRDARRAATQGAQGAAQPAGAR
jgi:lipopolysaccharide export system permease protein